MARSSVEEAFINVQRKAFLPDAIKDQAEWDNALPIGFGQTNSQPYTVRLMLEWLEAEPGNKILDVGSGSGWTSALLGYIVGPKGRIYAVEKIPELVEFGRNNCRQLGCKNIKFYRAGTTVGLPKQAPFDRILVSASTAKLPRELLDQLKVGGKLVIPVQEDILEIKKTSETSHETIIHPGFVFVPLV